jgi:hypothetical protein
MSVTTLQHPREYVHKECGYTTIMPEEVVEQYLHDPHTFGSNTFCAYCRKQVPDRECNWVETGESLSSYMQRLQQNHVPVAMVEKPVNKILDLNVRGFRRYLAIFLFMVGVIFPIDSCFRDGLLLETANVRSAPMSRFGGPRGRLVEATQESSMPWYLKPLAVVMSILALMLYLPNWGFKRYALIAGPMIGLGSIWLLTYWLTGRTSIHRFEPVLAAMLGALPGVAVWILLVRAKAHRCNLTLARAVS